MAFFDRMIQGMAQSTTVSGTRLMQGGVLPPNSGNNGRGKIRYGSNAAMFESMRGHNQTFVNNVNCIVPWWWSCALDTHTATNSAIEGRRMSAQVLRFDWQWEWMFKDATPNYGKYLLVNTEVSGGSIVTLPGNIVRINPSGNHTYEIWPGNTPNVPYPSEAFVGKQNRGLMAQARAFCVSIQLRKNLIVPVSSGGTNDLANAHFGCQLGTDPSVGQAAGISGLRYINDSGVQSNDIALGNFPYRAFDGDFNSWNEITDQWEWYGFVTAFGTPGSEPGGLGPPWYPTYNQSPYWYYPPYQITYDELLAHPMLDPDGGTVSVERRVVVFGNSLVAGDEPTNYSFRGPLFDSLEADGYDVDFRGPLSWSSLGSPELDHAGYGGATIGPDSSGNNLYSRINTALAGDNDVILIECGTNNITGGGNGTTNLVNEFNAFVLACMAREANARFVLVIPHPATYYSVDQNTARSNLVMAAQGLQAANPSRIWIFDLATVITNPATMLVDGLHFTETGAEVAAAGLLPVVKDALDGEQQVGEPIDPGDLQAGDNLTVIDADYRLGSAGENCYFADDGGGEIGAEVTSVDFGFDTLSFFLPGQTFQLEPDVTGEEGADLSVTYSVNGAAVTVDGAGLVTSVANGTAVITVRSVADPTKFDTLDVVVEPVAIAAPTFYAVAPGYSPKVIYGSGIVGALLRLYVDGTLAEEVTVDENGEWAISLTLAVGSYSLTANQIASASTSPFVGPVTLVIHADIVPPAPGEPGASKSGRHILVSGDGGLPDPPITAGDPKALLARPFRTPKRMGKP